MLPLIKIYPMSLMSTGSILLDRTYFFGPCEYGPKTVEISRAQPLPLAQVIDLPASKALCTVQRRINQRFIGSFMYMRAHWANPGPMRSSALGESRLGFQGTTVVETCDVWTCDWSMVGVSCMMWGKTVLPPSPQARRSSALSATTALLSLSSSFSNLTYYVKFARPCAARSIPPSAVCYFPPSLFWSGGGGGGQLHAECRGTICFLSNGYNHTCLPWVDRPPFPPNNTWGKVTLHCIPGKLETTGGGGERRAALGRKGGWEGTPELQKLIFFLCGRIIFFASLWIRHNWLRTQIKIRPDNYSRTRVESD